MKLIPLREGLFSVNKQKEFTLLKGAADLEQAMLEKQSILSIQPFFVNIANDFILLDAGLGLMDHHQPMICTLLAAQGINYTEINIILISHLHKDHTNGLGHFEEGNYVLNFPNAKIYIQRREIEWALKQENNPSYHMESLQALSVSPNVILLDEDEGTIGDFISFKAMGGHTIYHQVFWIRNQGRTIFYGGDNLAQLGYLKYQLAYKNDFDGKKALSLRQEWEQLAKKEHWEVLFYHDKKIDVKEF